MISNLRSFDCETNSCCQYEKNCIEKTKEKMNTDVRAFLVGAHFLYSHDLLMFALG